jgi:N-methylhydantoinase B
VLGGLPAAPSISRKQCLDGTVVDLPPFGHEVCRDGEKLVYRACGGGGYGPPPDRRRDQIIASVNRGWLSPQMAKRVYGVEIATGDLRLSDPGGAFPTSSAGDVHGLCIDGAPR